MENILSGEFRDAESGDELPRPKPCYLQFGGVAITSSSSKTKQHREYRVAWFSLASIK